MSIKFTTKHKMKIMTRAIIITICYLFFNLSFITAQDSSTKFSKAKIGIAFSSFGDNAPVFFEKIIGAPSYFGEKFHTLSINYLYPINTWLEAETGIEYAKHHIIIESHAYPGVEFSSEKTNLSLINIPLTLRANFLKYFFVNGGLIVNIDATKNSEISNQTGIGSLLGVAAKYDFNNGISVFVNPYTKIHALIPFKAENHHQRIWENGIRIGLTLSL